MKNSINAYIQYIVATSRMSNEIADIFCYHISKLKCLIMLQILLSSLK